MPEFGRSHQISDDALGLEEEPLEQFFPSHNKSHTPDAVPPRTESAQAGGMPHLSLSDPDCHQTGQSAMDYIPQQPRSLLQKTQSAGPALAALSRPRTFLLDHKSHEAQAHSDPSIPNVQSDPALVNLRGPEASTSMTPPRRRSNAAAFASARLASRRRFGNGNNNENNTSSSGRSAAPSPLLAASRSALGLSSRRETAESVGSPREQRRRDIIESSAIFSGMRSPQRKPAPLPVAPPPLSVLELGENCETISRPLTVEHGAPGSQDERPNTPNDMAARPNVTSVEESGEIFDDDEDVRSDVSIATTVDRKSATTVSECVLACW